MLRSVQVCPAGLKSGAMEPCATAGPYEHLIFAEATSGASKNRKVGRCGLESRAFGAVKGKQEKPSLASSTLLALSSLLLTIDRPRSGRIHRRFLEPP